MLPSTFDFPRNLSTQGQFVLQSAIVNLQYSIYQVTKTAMNPEELDVLEKTS
jgi:hypothetical protein